MRDDLDQTARMQFLAIDEGTRAALREFRPLLAQHVDGILDAFYAHVNRVASSAAAASKAFSGASASMDHVRQMQKRHWLDNLFTGTFGDEYFAQVVRIGQAHERAKLEPRWHLAGYCYALNRMIELAVANYRKKPERLAEVVSAINKAVFLDLDVAISVYGKATTESAASQVSQHADRFEREISTMVGAVASAATQMQSTAQSMSGTAEETRSEAESVASAAEQASANVETVAAATEELSASIQEISRQVSQSTQIASSAVDEAQRTNSMVQGLAVAAQRIGEVVKLINDIASQTNLLALNATIEAARAGDAGKGFAVVAGEVKNLANQTAKATDEISAQILAVQNATKDAVSAIQGIGTTITKMSEISSAIAAAVEEQGAATQEIARNVQEAAQGTGRVTATIGAVTVAAGDAGRSAQQVLTAAGALSQQADQLKGRVSGFLSDIRMSR